MFELNEEAKRVIHVLTQERPAVALLTGPAGTGKSTLIQRMREEVFPGMLLAAPTGIAALNIRGQTLHSLFRLPLGPLIPGDERIYKLRFRREQLQLFRKMDLLVIDEISMVRADTLDAVDAVLRMVMGKDEPFGGKRLLLCGDPFQLPPVVTGSELPLIREYYDAPYFFKAKVLEETGFSSLKLHIIHRQKDRGFISILEHIKRGTPEEDHLETLNKRLRTYDGSDFGIILCSLRAQAERINQLRMEALPGKAASYTGILKNQFRQDLLPVDAQLQLKTGAQVMMMRNDAERRWMNGTLAKIAHLADDHIEVITEDGVSCRVEKAIWEHIEYKWDDERKQIKEQVTGSYTQYPIKPAWAITIHKSQGLSFDRVHVHLGGHVFAPGQLYVALSRCTSLDGLTMERALKPGDFITDPALTEFADRL
ncbi:MAG: ATP-dependent RecD-like helicase [Bacteroidota bacterium]|jgi:ATP-dependent exoDNAse (exonuclease V) alpha subunit